MAMPGHVYLCVRIPPKYSIAYTVRRLKGKSAVRIYIGYIKKRGNSKGFHFCSTGSCLSTAGLDEVKIRKYSVIRKKKAAD